MGTVNQHDLINELAIRHGIGSAKAHEIHADYLKLIRKYLKAGHDVEINGFMIFKHENRAARTVRNMFTGEQFTLEPRTVVRVRNRSALNDWTRDVDDLTPVPDEKAQERLDHLYEKWINAKLEQPSPYQVEKDEQEDAEADEQYTEEY